MRFADEFGHYELNPFPGNSQVVVSNHAFILPGVRGLGYGKRQHKQRLIEAKRLGYSYIICTVNKANDAEIHILSTHGWRELDSFYNISTEHFVKLYGRALYDINP